MKLYHVTPGRNRVSIVTKGLVPRFGRGLTRGKRLECVWLTDDPLHILDTQAGADWMKVYNPVVVTVDASGLELKHKYGWQGLVVPHEWLYFGIIPPERILQISD